MRLAFLILAFGSWCWFAPARVGGEGTNAVKGSPSEHALGNTNRIGPGLSSIALPEAPKISLAIPAVSPDETNLTRRAETNPTNPGLSIIHSHADRSTTVAGSALSTNGLGAPKGSASAVAEPLKSKPPAAPPSRNSSAATAHTNAPPRLSAPANPALSPLEAAQSAEDMAWAIVRNSLVSPNLLNTADSAQEADPRKQYEIQLLTGQRQRLEKNLMVAEQTLIALMESPVPEDIQQLALLELALVARDENQPMRALQIYAQFLQRYPDDPKNPAVLLQQGLLYRLIGSPQLALGKFYAVMTMALRLKLDRIRDYQLLVLRAQIEIADTHFLAAQYTDAADYYRRLLNLDEPALNKAAIHYKLVRTLAFLNHPNEVVARAQEFLDKYSPSSDQAEVRFLYANALKQLGRNRDALQQVMILLQNQSRSAAQNPGNWTYWQQRTGNEIANQLYKEGDYVNALEIYLNLSQLDHAVTWQLPLWYQIGLVYEHLAQPQKAGEFYAQILTREKELGTNSPPSLQAVLDMAKWRKSVVGWDAQATSNSQPYRLSASLTNALLLPNGN